MWIIDTEYELKILENGNEEWRIHTKPTRIMSSDFDPKAFHTMPKHRFRLRDDDDNVYFEGYVSCVVGNDEELLAPLDDFGTPGYGAVWMDLLEADPVVCDRSIMRISGSTMINEIMMVRATWKRLNG
jgi:hypothetical protein